jgi:tetratricopeptide (TPR) repeat protein
VNDATKISMPVEAVHRVPINETLRIGLGLETIDLRLGLDYARTLLQRGAFGEAFRAYAALVLCDPTDSELQIGLSNCAWQVGEFELALQAASAAIAIEPTDPRGYCLSGKACLALGQLDEARVDLLMALELARPLEHFAFVVADVDALVLRLMAHQEATIETSVVQPPRADMSQDRDVQV